MFKSLFAARNARRAYELARLECLIAENRRQMDARQPDECRYCAATNETPKQREECDYHLGAAVD